MAFKVQAWGHGVLPLLSEHLEKHVDSILWQPLLDQEALLCNLLELALYRQHACAALSEDALMELGDYCQRKLVALNSTQPKSQQGASYTSYLSDIRMQIYAICSRDADLHVQPMLCRGCLPYLVILERQPPGAEPPR